MFVFSPTSEVGAPGGTRTHNPQLRRLVLYPVELRAPVVGVERFELPTSCSQSRRATRLRYTPRAQDTTPARAPPQRAYPGRLKLARPGDFWYQDALFFRSPEHELQLQQKIYPAYVPKKGEEYMNARQREHFKSMLETLKQELYQDIAGTVQTMQHEATIFADPNDRATQESDIALELRNRDRERKLIRKIEETIAKIEKDDYGYCDNCGVEIGLKRLEARPTATLCIDCKTLDEMRERQVGK
jgi:DnaK suppressor protein